MTPERKQQIDVSLSPELEDIFWNVILKRRLRP